MSMASGIIDPLSHAAKAPLMRPASCWLLAASYIWAMMYRCLFSKLKLTETFKQRELTIVDMRYS